MSLAQALRAEALAAFRTATGQQTTTGFRGHARPEPVGARSVQVTGIECTFHSGSRCVYEEATQPRATFAERREGY